MNQIILIRHAKVDLDNSRKIDSLSLQKWVGDYDSAPIHSNSLPSKEIMEIVKSANVVLTSTLRRAIDSAGVLGIEVHEQNSLFNEAGIPEVKIPFFKFKPKTWLVILRLLLLFGLGKKDTSLKASKIQAREATQKLLVFSENNERVVLVGHGGMNWLIRKVLMKEGWILEASTGHSNWGITVLQSS